MTQRSPARLLAPVALLAAAVALFLVISSSGGEDKETPAAAPPSATATAASGGKRDRPDDEDAAAGGGTYTIQPGDTPLEIAAANDVDLDDLLAANPGLDANALTVGQEIQLP